MEILLQSANTAGDNWVVLKSGESNYVGFPAIGHWPNDRVATVFAVQKRGHAARRTLEENVQEECLQNIIRVVAERDFAAAFLNSNVVENSPPQARAQRAGRFALLQCSFDNGVGVFLNNAKWNFVDSQIFRKHVRREARLFLIEVYSQQFEADRCAHLQVAQQREERETVLAAAQADHDAVPVNDHVEIRDGLSNASQKFPFQQLLLGSHRKLKIVARGGSLFANTAQFLLPAQPGVPAPRPRLRLQRRKPGHRQSYLAVCRERRRPGGRMPPKAAFSANTIAKL